MQLTPPPKAPTRKLVKNQKPIVDWQPPEKTPDVKKGEANSFWVAVRRNHNGSSWDCIFDAQYVNKPLEYASDDPDKEEPIGDYFEDSDGMPVSAIGWHNTLNHPEYSSYYEPITFDENNVLVGWGKYLKPDFPVKP
ncbi:hypothetical protein [Pseudoalteromonas sp. S16_S37]|uniref:hypothetical protein n=1 Tax=Pseudoalteromonas sp. S16_S37 TaxID=2720228 RepID=UPI00168102F8|nr:hypothetical protein [Pseudoalteromonas sp. S16_S37]MBD1583472.1 hypothetical protein [Pseudoalteromonas sp. S16_S37]